MLFCSAEHIIWQKIETNIDNNSECPFLQSFYFFISFRKTFLRVSVPQNNFSQTFRRTLLKVSVPQNHLVKLFLFVVVMITKCLGPREVTIT